MRVSIKHRQEDGLGPTKRHFVDCTVLFSEEEKAIIQARGLREHYFEVASAIPPPAGWHYPAAGLLKKGAAILLMLGLPVSCVIGLSANGPLGDTLGGVSLFGGLALFLAGVAFNRQIRVAEQPKQAITFRQLLSNPSFSIYAPDNATAKAIDEDLRRTLTRLKDTLLANMDIRQSETFEL